MFKQIFRVLLAFMIFPFTTNAEWVPFDNTRAQKAPPNITLLSDNQTSSVFKVEISGFELSEITSAGKTYQSIDLLSEMFMNDPGRPELPYLAKILAVPDYADVTVEVIGMGEVHTFHDMELPPARRSWYEGEPEPVYTESRDAYRSDRFYPDNMTQIDPPSIFRDFRITRVSVFPARYNPAKKELQVCSSITVRVNYGTGMAENPKTTPKKAIAPSFGKIYRSMIFNYQEVLDEQYGGREDGRELILCIMPDEFYASFQVYADWKRQSGTDVHITKFTDIGANATNPDIIKNHITDAYHNWDYPPTYVLIIGDDEVFPKKIVTYPDYSFPNEDYFVEIDGNDYFPEMMIGRFTNQGDYRMQVMIYKFMLYEKTPDISSTDWFKKGTVCSNNEYESQKETKRYARSMMLYGGFTSVDTLLSDGSGWGGDCTVDLDDVLDAINDGRSYLNYRGEGWSSGWQASCYSFETSDVSGLSNGEKFTFVTSIGCGVAMFDTWGANNCFGEEWVELGSLTAPRGAVAFVGPTSNTHTTYNNKIDKGIYTGMFTEGMETPGEALLRGKLYMYNVFGNDYYTQYHFKVYCILGDPSIHIWKDVPLAVDVVYPESILVGPEQVEVTVNFAQSGIPAVNAEVCLTGDEIFATGYCNAEGKAFIDVEPGLPDTLKLTVRGTNVYPFQAEIEVIQPLELVEPEGYPQLTDLDGNLDGLINPNENCSATFTLKNWGSQTANNVSAVLLTSAPELVQIITIDPVSFGNLAPGNDYTGAPFQLFVSPDCPVGQLLPLQLHVISTDNAWDYYYQVKVNGCDLAVDCYLVNDLGSPEPNYRMDPGESVMLFVSIKNQGNDVAPNVSGLLSSEDPYITIEDLYGTYGAISIDDNVLNLSDYYRVSVDPACPVNYLAEYALQLNTSNGNYPYQANLAFTVPVSKPAPSDFTGPDAYGYYAYSSDEIFDQAPDYSWKEIDLIGFKLNNAGLGDYTQTVSLPFSFKYYGIEYNQVRISTDGWIAFGSGTQTAPVNTGLPNADNINNMAAGFWDDLYDAETVEGDIYYYSDVANRRFIIEWDSIARNDYGQEPNVEIFQMVLYDPDFYPTLTGDGEIVMFYKQVQAPESNTIGIENSNQTVGIQYLFNNVYDPTASAMMNEFAIKFTTEPPEASIITGTGKDNFLLTGNGYKLNQNHPNPFNANTWITYTLPESCTVTLQVFDVEGSLIRTIQAGKKSPGNHTAEWNGLNDAGFPVSPGIYFCQLKTDSFKETIKMFLIK